MQTIKVEIQDDLVEKILWLLNSLNGVKVETIHDNFLEEIKNSEDDILNGKITEIGDVDSYIENLKNEIN
ncbi:MAG: hypothetical protein KAH84_12900 [Thiomargarita sp.]|nr:hypothetical protein [Thiomargarita sp.]